MPSQTDRAKRPFRLRPRWGDYLIAALILLAAGLLALHYSARAQGTTALVYENGVLTHTLSLSGNGQYVLELSHVVLEINGGRIRFASSDCPDQICVHTGWISKAGQSAICLPNHVAVFIEGNREAEVDAVT